MKLSVAFPFAMPTRTLAVLLMGVALGGSGRVAYSQATLPDANGVPTNGIATNGVTTNGVGAPDNATDADNDANPDQTAQRAQAANTNGVYAVAPNSAARVPSRQNMVERRMRDMMSRNGITVTTTQDAILTFLRDDEENKRTVRDAGRKLWNGIRRDVPAERLRSLLSDYQKALETAHDNREHAQTALDARVGYSLDARLESLLWLLGVLGEGQTVFTLPSQPSPMARGPRMAGGTANAPLSLFAVPTGTLQIAGVVNAKNTPDETLVWLEIRDDNGRLWRMVPSNSPDAQSTLARQIGDLSVGSRIVARLVTPAVMTPTTPYSVVALSDATATAEEATDGDGGGEATDNQYK